MRQNDILFVNLRDAADPDVGGNQGVGLDESDAFVVLAFNVFHKLAPADRHALEQITDLDNGPFCHWGWCLGLDDTVRVIFDQEASWGSTGGSCHSDMGERAKGRQCLTSEAKGADIG